MTIDHYHQSDQIVDKNDKIWYPLDDSQERHYRLGRNKSWSKITVGKVNNLKFYDFPL